MRRSIVLSESDTRSADSPAPPSIAKVEAEGRESRGDSSPPEINLRASAEIQSRRRRSARFSLETRITAVHDVESLVDALCWCNVFGVNR